MLIINLTFIILYTLITTIVRTYYPVLIDFMLLIQFIVIINLILLLIDFILLIQLMPAWKGSGPRPKRPRTKAHRAMDQGLKGRELRHEGPKTEAQRAKDRGPQGTVGRKIIGRGQPAPSPRAKVWGVM